MLNERRRRVLNALIEEYISSAQPVGSRTLVERYELGCSPATVRNELAILEETGFVVQPHISAGRIPTDIGYRTFVDDLLDPAAAPPFADSPETERLARAVEIGELMHETSTLLAQLTNCMAVTLAPLIAAVAIRRLDLLAMGPRRVLFVLITETGQVVNRHIDLVEEVLPERVAEVERSLNASLVGKRASDVRPLRAALGAPRPEDHIVVRVLDEVVDALEEADRSRLHHVGVTGLLAQPEFAETGRLRPVISALEDGVVVLEALQEALTSSTVTVRIGQENMRPEFGGVSIVASGYGVSGADGVVGVIGPTRMDYHRAISAVRGVAQRLDEALG